MERLDFHGSPSPRPTFWPVRAWSHSSDRRHSNRCVTTWPVQYCANSRKSTWNSRSYLDFIDHVLGENPVFNKAIVEAWWVQVLHEIAPVALENLPVSFLHSKQTPPVSETATIIKTVTNFLSRFQSQSVSHNDSTRLLRGTDTLFLCKYHKFPFPFSCLCSVAFAISLFTSPLSVIGPLRECGERKITGCVWFGFPLAAANAADVPLYVQTKRQGGPRNQTEHTNEALFIIRYSISQNDFRCWTPPPLLLLRSSRLSARPEGRNCGMLLNTPCPFRCLFTSALTNNLKSIKSYIQYVA